MNIVFASFLLLFSNKFSVVVMEKHLDMFDCSMTKKHTPSESTPNGDLNWPITFSSWTKAERGLFSWHFDVCCD
jgi:hypothetical protein